MYIIVSDRRVKKKQRGNVIIAMCSTVWDPIFSIVGRASRRGERKRNYPSRLAAISHRRSLHEILALSPQSRATNKHADIVTRVVIIAG